MYFALVDRFYDSDGQSMPVDGVTGMTEGGSSGQYEGGDLAGVTAKMGYLADLGATALWISAPFENRNSRGRGINDPRWYSGYHGYWPSPPNIDYSDPDNPDPLPEVEDRIGTMSDLEALIASAKSATSADGHGIKVLLDYVMNHVDDESPLYLENPTWFTKDDEGNIPLCQPNNWWNHPFWGTRCAFAPYLPAFDFWQEEPRRWSVNDALWWAKRLGLDGYRLDAIKHVPFEWLTELRTRIEDEIGAPSGDRFYLVGETFDYDNRNLLKSFIDPDTMLDGQFDFPFKKRLCEAVFGTGGLTSFATWMDGNDGFYDVEAVHHDDLDRQPRRAARHPFRLAPNHRLWSRQRCFQQLDEHLPPAHGSSALRAPRPRFRRHDDQPGRAAHLLRRRDRSRRWWRPEQPPPHALGRRHPQRTPARVAREGPRPGPRTRIGKGPLARRAHDRQHDGRHLGLQDERLRRGGPGRSGRAQPRGRRDVHQPARPRLCRCVVRRKCRGRRALARAARRAYPARGKLIGWRGRPPFCIVAGGPPCW